jgi:hypothetical protein
MSKLPTNKKVEMAAKAAHEVNREYCISLGDVSQPKWEDAPGWQKDSAIHGVEAIVQNPNQPPSASHDNWLAEKQAAGWKCGPVKDPDKKEHPCIVPYNDLPVDQRMKDTIFLAVVKGVLGIE